MESEVYDLHVEGEDDIEDEDTFEEMSSGPSKDDTKVDVIQPSDVRKGEYCIV
jgi:hypothetical protein